MRASATGTSQMERRGVTLREKRTVSVQLEDQLVRVKECARGRDLHHGRRNKLPCRLLRVASDFSCTLWITVRLGIARDDCEGSHKPQLRLLRCPRSRTGLIYAYVG